MFFDTNRCQILLIEDNPGDARLLSEYLREQDNFILHHCAWLEDALQFLQIHSDFIDVILLDLTLPDSDGLDSFHRLRVETPDTAIVVLTGLDSEDMATTAMREGAQDYLLKDMINERTLTRSLRYAMERQRHEKQVRLLAVERERAKMMQNFMIDTAHDVRTPLSIVNSSVYLLVKSEDPQKRLTYGRRIQKQVERLEHIFQQITDMADLESMTALNTRLFNVNTLVQQLVVNYATIVEEKQLHLQSNLQDSLPLVSVDEWWLTNAIRQLIDNAICWSNVNDIVRLQTYREDDGVIIEISDTGTGIPAEDLHNVFERFYRVDKARQIDKGSTGLGLAIAHRIISLHNGTITVESEEAVGSMFRIKLPLEKDRE